MTEEKIPIGKIARSEWSRYLAHHCDSSSRPFL